jgi:multidrug resistance efflux pump
MKVHRDQKAAVEEAQQRFQELLDQHTNVGFLVEVSKSSETKAEEEILKARTDMEGWEAIFKDLEKVEKELDKAVEALEGAQKDWDAYRSAWDHIQEMHNTLVEKMEEANREMTDALS